MLVYPGFEFTCEPWFFLSTFFPSPAVVCFPKALQQLLTDGWDASTSKREAKPVSHLPFLEYHRPGFCWLDPSAPWDWWCCYCQVIHEGSDDRLSPSQFGKWASALWLRLDQHVHSQGEKVSARVHLVIISFLQMVLLQCGSPREPQIKVVITICDGVLDFAWDVGLFQCPFHQHVRYGTICIG